MRFKITKLQFGTLKSFFDKSDDSTEIDLEPIIDTATQAIYEQDLKNRSYQQGFERGYKEGYYDRRNCKEPKYYCTCGCGGTTCWNRHCDCHCK